jgi:hypothetical protein
MTLYMDSGGAPGNLLESWSVTLPGLTQLPPGTTLTSVLHPSLFAGTQYWFVLTPASGPGTFVNWNLNDQGVIGGVWAGSSLSSLTKSFATDPTPGIQLTSVPEPGSAGLFALGSLIIAVAVRKTLSRSFYFRHLS